MRVWRAAGSAVGHPALVPTALVPAALVLQ